MNRRSSANRCRTRSPLVAGVLCNDAGLDCDDGRWRIVGDPTEGALIVAARKAALDETELLETFPRTGEIPFSSEQQFMATLRESRDNQAIAYLKGAPEVVARMCPAFFDGQPMSEEGVHEAVQAMATHGMCVLAMAWQHPARAVLTWKLPLGGTSCVFSAWQA